MIGMLYSMLFMTPPKIQKCVSEAKLGGRVQFKIWKKMTRIRRTRSIIPSPAFNTWIQKWYSFVHLEKMRVYLILCTHVQKIPHKKLPFIYRRALSFHSLSARFTHEPFTITYEAHISDFHELCIGILLLRSFTNLISERRFRNYLFSTHSYARYTKCIHSK